MDLTKLQLSELMCKHAQKGNGLHDLLEIMIESMMVAERGEFLAENRVTRVTATVPAPRTGAAGNWSFAFRVTATGTSIHRYWLF